MSQTTFYIVIGVVVIALVLPLLNLIVVRFFVKLRDEPEPEGAPVDSLGDFWQGMLPHLLELRNRLLASLVAVILCTIVGFALVQGVFGIRGLLYVIPELLLPADVLPLQGTEVAETFTASIRLSLLIGISLAVPVIVYQLVRFFLPAMTAAEKRVLFIALPFVTELFLAGLVFGWFVTLPAALRFLTEFGSDETVIRNIPRVSSFYDLLTTLLLWNGVIFLTPAIIYLLTSLGIITPRQLANSRRYAVIIIVIIAALITPTGDPYNLLLLALPMYLLFELGILLARLAPKSAELKSVQT